MILPPPPTYTTHHTMRLTFHRVLQQSPLDTIQRHWLRTVPYCLASHEFEPEFEWN